jgi:hypothetical protein
MEIEAGHVIFPLRVLISPSREGPYEKVRCIRCQRVRRRLAHRRATVPLDIPFTQAIKSVSRRGAGSKTLVAAMKTDNPLQ